jgi:hypothetical protein
MTIAATKMDAEEREGRVIKFCHEIAGEAAWPEISKVLADAGVAATKLNREEYTRFMDRGFHPEIIRHSRSLYTSRG